MKLLFVYTCIVPLFVYHACTGGRPAPPPGAGQVKTEITDTIRFDDQVKPILVKNCSPCHFPGGKMYARMPFDQDTTILRHESGILKRIKGEENQVIRAFIGQNKNGSSSDKPSS